MAPKHLINPCKCNTYKKWKTVKETETIGGKNMATTAKPWWALAMLVYHFPNAEFLGVALHRWSCLGSSILGGPLLQTFLIWFGLTFILFS